MSSGQGNVLAWHHDKAHGTELADATADTRFSLTSTSSAEQMLQFHSAWVLQVDGLNVTVTMPSSKLAGI